MCVDLTCEVWLMKVVGVGIHLRWAFFACGATTGDADGFIGYDLLCFALAVLSVCSGIQAVV